MSNYYRISDPSDVRDLGEQMAAWVAAGNPKANDWALQPAAPSADAVWTNGAWVVPPAPTFTAEEWVANFLSSTQLIALADLRLDFALQGKPLTPLMQQLRDWTTQLMVSWAADPTPRSDWSPAPCSYEQASAEAVAGLQS